MSRRREHLLLRIGELCQRRVADYFSGCATRRHTPCLSAVRQGRTARRRHRYHCGYRLACGTVQIWLEAISQMPQPNNAATKVEHPEKILCISFVAHDQSPEVLQPGKPSLGPEHPPREHPPVTPTKSSSVADCGAGDAGLEMLFRLLGPE